MDRATIVSYLQAAEDHVANGEEQIADQRDHIASLERAGHDTTTVRPTTSCPDLEDTSAEPYWNVRDQDLARSLKVKVFVTPRSPRRSSDAALKACPIAVGYETATVAPMDRALIVTSLQAADDRIAIGARQISKQRDYVSRLEREGEDTTNATALLREMQRTQESHIAHRDRLREKLAALKAAKGAKPDTPVSN